MNTVTLMGRFSQEPEIRYTAAGKPVYNFSFAVSRRFVRTDNDPKADFFRCVAFNSTAERLEKCKLGKGVKLLIQGELQNQTYTDRDGVKRTTTQIIVNDFDFCESKSQGQTQTASSPAPARQQAAKNEPAALADPEGFMQMDDALDDLPFV